MNRFEKVSIAESQQHEWWLIRKCPNAFNTDNTTCNNNERKDDYFTKSYAYLDANKSHTSEVSPGSSYSLLSHRSKRLSDINNMSKSINKRISTGSDLKNETNIANKSLATPQNDSAKNVNIKTKLDLNFMEEELYVKGNVVIWSKRLVNNSDSFDNAGVTVCSYSSQFPIKHALWCTFYNERPSFDKTIDRPLGDSLSALCIVDSQNIRIFTADSEDFISSVPFQVSKVWNTKYGVLLEKEFEGKSYLT